jgi:hypothetical protein
MFSNRALFVKVALVAAIAVASFGAAAQPPELTLYGARLKDATVESFTAAAIAAGAKRKTGGEFDARAMGVPALESFGLFASGKNLIGVQFNVERSRANDEKLRQMLLTKYGEPQFESTWKSEKFTSQYIEDGSYKWTFAHGMLLVYKKPFFSSEATTLTYVDKGKLDAIEQAAKAAEQRDASKKVQSHSDKF